MKRLIKNYLPLLAIAFLHAAAAAAIILTEAIYLREGLQASYSLIGSVLGAGAIGYLLLAPYLVNIPKRIGRGRYLVWSSFALALSAIAAANLTNAAGYFFTKTAIILLAPTSFHAILDSVEETYRYKKNKDRRIFAASLTAALGGIIGFITGGYVASIAYGHAYALATALLLTAGFISLQLKNNPEKPRYEETQHNLIQRIETCLTKKHRLLTIVVIATNAYWALRDLTIPLLLTDMGYTPATIGILFALGAVAGVISMFATRHLLEKNHPERVIIAALLLAAVASLILPFGGLIVIGIMYALYVFADAALTPAVSDRVEETTPPKQAAPFLQSLAAPAALAWVLAPWIAGVALEAGASLRVILFIAGALLALVYEAARRKWLAEDMYIPPISFKKNKKELIWR